MIFNVKNTIGLGKKCKVFAYPGLEIVAVTKYNTRTREVEMFILGRTEDGGTRPLTRSKSKTFLSREVVKVKVKIPGSFIIVDGKKY